jgi:tRNA pseudouridine38-40 synthase
MVRSLAGALVAVGAGKLTVEDLRRILDSGRRTAAVPTAPPHGLFLTRVTYGRAKPRVRAGRETA